MSFQISSFFIGIYFKTFIIGYYQCYLMYKNFQEFCCGNKFIISIIGGFFLSFISLFYIQNFRNPVPVIFFIIGIGISLLSLLFFITSRIAEKKHWGYFYLTIILFTLIIGFNFVLQTSYFITFQPLLITYITIDTIILAVNFAAITINSKDLVTRLKNEPSIDMKRFKKFIVVTTFGILFSLAIYCVTLIQNFRETFITIAKFNIQINVFHLFFLFVTFLTFILICNMMFYTSKILDIILKDS